ncbi:MAG: aminoglycoside phosphotransferase family protein [Arenimonas sp.]
MTDDDRATLRLAWLRQALDDPHAPIESASADASFRSYWRSASGGRTWILMDAPPEREDIGPWLDIAGRLARAGLHAPEVRASDAAHGFVLMADLGEHQYQPSLVDETVDSLYGDALAALLVIQTRVDTDGLPDYDHARLVTEMELLPEWFLRRHLGVEPGCDGWDEIERAFGALADAALAQPQAFVHRDYHSRNLLVTPERNPGIIDFQDAVRGPVTYDLVSLLRDCYIEWPDERVHAWVEAYRRRLLDAGVACKHANAFRRDFDLMGLQRHIKVLGIFCRLWYRDGKRSYLRDLPLVWEYTRRVGLRHPETAPLVRRIAAWLGDRDITVPAP